MLIELHAHTSKHSVCSKIEPVELVKLIKAKHLQGLVITEHHYLWTDEELSELRKKSEVEDSFLILSAQEIESEIGHILLFGADHTLPSLGEPYRLAAIRKLFPDAAIIWAHPFRKGKLPSKAELLERHIDAVEIFNTNQTLKENYTGLSKWHRYKFAAVSGSDTHTADTAGAYPTLFDHPIKSIKEIAEEIKHSRCRPFLKEIPKSGSNIIVTEITFGTKGSDESRNRVIVKSFKNKKYFDRANIMTAIPVNLYNEGFKNDIYRVPKVIDINDADMTIIEEGQRGKSLFELLSTVNPVSGIEYFKLAAKWLAKLHNMELAITDYKTALKREIKRFDSYLNAFKNTSSPFQKDAATAADYIKRNEIALFSRKAGLIQSHGDYHPKNIIIGQDRMQDITTLYISVIDFDSSMLMPVGFDAGYFLAQFKSQFFSKQNILEAYNENIFIDAYVSSLKNKPSLIEDQIKFFKLRANLSITAFLIKFGKGTSDQMKSIMEELISSVKKPAMDFSAKE